MSNPEERRIGVAGDPFAAVGQAAVGQAANDQPLYCVACCESDEDGALETVAASGPYCRDQAVEVAAELRAMEGGAGTNAYYYPRPVSPFEAVAPPVSTRAGFRYSRKRTSIMLGGTKGGWT